MPDMPELNLKAEFPPTPHAQWRAAAEESLEGAPFEKKLVTKLPEGIDLQPIYDAETAPPVVEAWPGVAPYTRGTEPLGANERPWLVLQELPYGTPEDFNRAARLDLARGQNALQLPLDVATRRGIDPDQARAGEVGMCGLSLCTVADVAKALEGIDIAATPLFVWAGCNAQPLAGLLAAAVQQRRIPLTALQGGVLGDPLAEYAREGSLPATLDELHAETAALTSWAAVSAPNLRTIGVQGALWADCGGNAVQELAFALASGVEYIRELTRHGVTVGVSAPRCVWTLSLGSHLFTNIAKLRAARRLWARAVGAFGGGPAAQRLWLHGRCSLFNKTALDPYVNLLRATTEGFAGAIGGCDSLHVAAFDEAVRIPDDFARRIARNVQVILAEECHFSRVADPAGGSWYVETLTEELAQKAWALFQEVERRGGMGAALRFGYPQEQVAQAQAAELDAVAKRRSVVVGVNMFPNLKEQPLPPNGDMAHQAALQQKLARRAVARRTEAGHIEQTSVLARLAELLDAPAERRLQLVQEAFGKGATLGEVVRTLRTGVQREPDARRTRFVRRSDGFEKLRAATAAFTKRTGAAPRVWLANFGPPKQHRARADFSAGFFAVAGFEVKQGKGAATPEEAATAAAAAGARVVVLCSTDDTYPALVPPFVKALKAAAPQTHVVLAGFPQDQVEAHKAAGVDDFIHVRLSVLDFLAGLQKRLGIA